MWPLKCLHILLGKKRREGAKKQNEQNTPHVPRSLMTSLFFFPLHFNSCTFFYTMLDIYAFFYSFFLWYVINRSFICGREAIRSVHMQYSVHTIKIKFKTYIKTKLWRKKSYNLRDMESPLLF